MKKYILIILAIYIASCSNVKSISYGDAPVPEESNEISYMYVYREMATPFLHKAYIEIDGEEVMALSNENYTWAPVKPGLRNIKYTWGLLGGMPTVKFDMKFEAGKTYAFEVMGQASQYLSTSELSPRPLTTALKTIEECCGYVPPVNK